MNNMENASLNTVIGGILKDSTDFEGNILNFNGNRVYGVGRYVRSDRRENYPIILDLNLCMSLPVRNRAGLEYVLSEAVYNSIKAYRDSQIDTEIRRVGGIKIYTYKTDRDFRVEIEDHAGGVPKEILTETLDKDKTIRRSKEKKTGAGHGLKEMKKILEKLRYGFDVNLKRENGEVIGTKLTIRIPFST